MLHFLHRPRPAINVLQLVEQQFSRPQLTEDVCLMVETQANRTHTDGSYEFLLRHGVDRQELIVDGQSYLVRQARNITIDSDSEPTLFDESMRPAVGFNPLTGIMLLRWTDPLTKQSTLQLTGKVTHMFPC